MGTQVCSWLHCRWKSFRHFCGHCEERRQRYSRPHRYHYPSSFGTQACLQDPQAFQLDQGRQRVPVRYQEAPSSKYSINSSQMPVFAFTSCTCLSKLISFAILANNPSKVSGDTMLSSSLESSFCSSTSSSG